MRQVKESLFLQFIQVPFSFLKFELEEDVEFRLLLLETWPGATAGDWRRFLETSNFFVVTRFSAASTESHFSQTLTGSKKLNWGIGRRFAEQLSQ